MGLMTGTGPLGKDPAGTFNFEPPPPGRALYMEPCLKRVRVEVGGETIADSRRTLLLSRVRPPAGLLLPARGRARRRARALRPAHALPEEGRGVLPHDPGRRHGGGERRLVLPGPARGRGAAQGPDRVLLRPDGPLVRGGRGDLRPPARSLPPGRRASRPRGTSGSRSTASCWPRPDQAMALFESEPADPLVPAPRGRLRPSSSPPTRRPAARTRESPATTPCAFANGETVKDLIWYYERSAARGRQHRRPAVLLQRARRRGGRRRARGPARDHLEATGSSPRPRRSPVAAADG